MFWFKLWIISPNYEIQICFMTNFGLLIKMFLFVEYHFVFTCVELVHLLSLRINPQAFQHICLQLQQHRTPQTNQVFRHVTRYDHSKQSRIFRSLLLSFYTLSIFYLKFFPMTTFRWFVVRKYQGWATPRSRRRIPTSKISKSQESSRESESTECSESKSSGVDLKILKYDSDYESIIEFFYQYIRQWLAQKIPDSEIQRFTKMIVLNFGKNSVVTLWKIKNEFFPSIVMS